MTNLIEVSEWLRGNASEQMRPVTIRTNDQEEVSRFRQNLPADYRWIDGSELLKEGEGK